MIGVRVTVGPTEEPVSLGEAKSYLRIDGTDEDASIADLIVEAREAAEAECGRAFVTQTLTLTLDDFPWPEIRVPRPPLQSVTWVKYYDADGVLQTIDAADYHVATAGEPGRIVPVAGGYWPVPQYGRPESVQVRYIAGYGSASAVPAKAKGAIKLILAARYMHRGDDSTVDIPPAVRRLLNSLEYGEVH